jgi:hypothetical protein
MLKRLWTGAAVGLAASLSLATAVRADVVTFNSITSEMVFSDTWDHGGLSFSGYQFWILPPDYVLANPSTFPSPVTSTVMSTYIEPMTMTLTAGGAFDFNSISTALGWFNNPAPDFTDTETVTGHKAGCVGDDCTVQTSFSVGYSFQNHVFDNFTDLDSVTFGALTQQFTPPPPFGGDPIPYTGFIGFDDITVSAPGSNGTGSVGVGEPPGGPVPEPAAWSLLIAGFAGVGAMLRRGRRSAATA